MSQETVLKTLVDLGFDVADAQVYLFLAKRGQQKALDICRALKINKQTLYPCLKRLESRGIVTSTVEHPAKFSALAFEEVLDLFINTKIEEARSIRESKKEILANWQSIQIDEANDAGHFSIIQGRKYIYSRIQQMIKEAKTQISCISSVAGLARADQFGLFQLPPSEVKQDIKFRFLTELNDPNTEAMSRLLKEIEKSKILFEGRTPEVGLPLFPRIVIRDDNEVVFFIAPHNDTPVTEQDDVCLWTNCASLVCAFRGIFEELWRNATNIEQKIHPTERSLDDSSENISDGLAAKRVYDATLSAALKEIIMITSAEDLTAFSKNTPLLQSLTMRGVYVRIMAPITGDNFDAEQIIAKYCQVRHVPTSNLNTTIIDGQYFFQFGNPTQSSNILENAVYSTDKSFIDKVKTTLDNVWNNASAPSSNTLEVFLKPLQTSPIDNQIAVPAVNTQFHTHRTMREVSAFEISEEKTLTEKDIVDTIILGKKYVVNDPLKDLTRTYGYEGQAVIHPPKFLSLPDLMIHAFHNDKQSSYGNEDYIVVYLWLPTPNGSMFVPVAVVGDVAEGQNGLRKVWAGTPAGENVRIVTKDQLQVQLHGNNFFAGWTVPIPLVSGCILPPSAVLLEAFGKLKTGRFTVTLPSGCRVSVEHNGFSAFVTFFNPASKYSGPGTDGFVSRDLIMTTVPPQAQKVSIDEARSVA